MTLNITIASRWMITQTSDFRLSIDGRIESDVAQKQFALIYPDWAGLLSYTGIARYRMHDTAAWLSTLLVHPLGDSRSARQVVELIRSGGGDWLKTVPGKFRKHTFTLVTYERSRPTIYMISNFERAGQNDLVEPLDTFLVSRHQPRWPRVYVTGIRGVITPGELQTLQTLVSEQKTPEEVRRAAAHINRNVSHRCGVLVGENCISSHMLPGGSGEMQVFGNPTAAFLPMIIANGQNLSGFNTQVLQQMGRKGAQRLVGMTWSQQYGNWGVVQAIRDVSNTDQPGW